MTPAAIMIAWPQFSLADDISKTSFNADTTVYTIRDLWKSRNLGTTEQALRADIPSHDVLMLRMTKSSTIQKEAHTK
jgi:alpha-galactosidase